jgi:hypothetical protein
MLKDGTRSGSATSGWSAGAKRGRCSTPIVWSCIPTRRQYDAEAAQVSASGRSSTDARSAEGNGYEQVDPASTTAQRIAETTNVAVAEAGKPVAPTRFYGALTVNDPNRLTSTAQVLSKEIIQHLTSLLGAQVRITLEIQATIPDGAPDHVTRIVTENCKTLKFDQAGFEEE